MKDQNSGTDPEVAWSGVTEAMAAGCRIGKGVFPKPASGRSLSPGRSEGLTEVISDAADDWVMGASLAGPNAGDLAAEAALAIGMDADAVEPARSINPRPMPGETVGFPAGTPGGTITGLIPPVTRS